MSTCTYDSGSALGNTPACDERATVRLTWGGYGGPFTGTFCARCAKATEGRVYPHAVAREVL